MSNEPNTYVKAWVDIFMNRVKKAKYVRRAPVRSQGLMLLKYLGRYFYFYKVMCHFNVKDKKKHHRKMSFEMHVL